MKVIALDRDGVINFDSEHYILHQNDWHPIPGSLEAIKKAKEHGFIIAIISNQSALSRKMIDPTSFHAINQKFLSNLKDLGGHIDLFLVCPHTPEQNCNCRKPKSGLFYILKDLLNCDLERTVFIGDRLSDVQAAKNVGAKSILVETGKPIKEAAISILRFKNLEKAINCIIKNYENL